MSSPTPRPPTSRYYFETSVEVPGDPLSLVDRLARSGPHHDYLVYERGGAYSYAGGTLAELTLDRDGARLRGAAERSLGWDGDPIGMLRTLLGEVPVRDWRAYGWTAFELSYASGGDRAHLGDQRLAHLVVPISEVRVADGRARLRSSDPATLSALLELLTARPGDVAPAGAPTPVDVRGRGGAPYRQAVAAAVADIANADLSKVILSRVVELDGEIDLVSTYLVGRRGNNPARSFLLRMDGLEAAGFSPEIVASVTADGQVVSQPLAGTRALGPDLAANRVRRADLLSCAKEIYEHAISVKIGNDELLTVCEPDSVGVRDLMSVQERGSVQHLASRVTGRLRPGKDQWDAFAAVFPAVTASGVPKPAAYSAIRRYESEPRGLYSGAVVVVEESGALDAALVLRSVYRQHGRTWLRAGAGIVGQSEPVRELEETCEKLDSVARFLVRSDSPSGPRTANGHGTAKGHGTANTHGTNGTNTDTASGPQGARPAGAHTTGVTA